MDDVFFYQKQADKIARMKPDRVEVDKDYPGSYNHAVGYKTRRRGESFMLCVEFRYRDQPGAKRMYFEWNRAEKILSLKHGWLDNPILNRAGLASLIWDEDDRGTLRRRLEQKASRGTFRQAEIDRILLEVERFYNEVKKSLKK